MTIVALLTLYKDCFAWDYSEMPGLDRDLIEHYFPIKPEFWSFHQLLRRMAPEVATQVKAKIEHLVKVRFIHMTRYIT